VNWSDVRIVLAVAEHGTLQQAAVALSVNHTTVWRRLQALEKSMGAQLFISDRYGHQLTDVGKQIIHHAQTVADNMESIERIVSGDKTELSGVIRLTAPVHATNTLFPRLLKEFQLLYPQIRFELLLDNAELDIEKREADIAIRGTHKVPENLIGRCIGKTNWSLYVSDELYQGRLMSLEEIKQLPLIGYSHFNNPAGKWHADTFKEVTKTVVCGGLENGRGFAEVGMGVALLPSNMETSLREIYKLPEELGAELWLLTHQEMRTSAKIKALWDFMLEKLLNHDQLMPTNDKANQSN
jgi:DNA-binding transcriptional LysR family regulator